MNKIRKNLCLTVFLLGCLLETSAQSRILIAVTERGGSEVMAFSTVTLAPARDSGRTFSAITGKQGSAELKCKPGEWVLKVTHINYIEFDTVLNVDSSVSVRIDIGLTKKEDKGDTIVVMGNKKDLAFTNGGYEYTPDRQRAALVVNLGALLKLLPGITLDHSGVPKVMGQPFLLWVDGQRILLRGAELASFISGFSAEDIKTVRVYTTPPAIFDAAGSTVIEIITVKNIKKGLEERVEANARTHDKYYSGLYLGYANMGYSGVFRVSYDHSTVRYSEGLDQVNFSAPDSLFRYHSRTSTPKFTINVLSLSTASDFALDPRNTIGITARLNDYTDPQSLTRTDLSVYNTMNQPTEDQLFERLNRSHNLFLFGGVNYRSILNKKGARFTMDASEYSRASHVSFDQFTQALDANSGSLSLSDVEKRFSRNKAAVYIASATYSDPIGHGMMLRIGGKLTLANNQENISDSSSPDRVKYSLDTTGTYNLRYIENVGALFTSLGGNFGKLKYQAGLRWEATKTDIRTISAPADSENIRRYSDLFPSLSISYAPSTSTTIGLGAKRSIIRPAYDQLNPLPVQMSAVLVTEGNPQLQPILQYAFDLNASKQTNHGNWSLMAKYSISQNPYIPIVMPSGPAGHYLQISLNYKSNNSIYVNLSCDVKATKWLQITANIYGFDTWIDLDHLQGLINPKAVPTGGFLLSGTISFWNNAAVEFDNYYQSAQVSSQGRGGAFYYTDISFTKRLSRSWNITAKVSDIFNTDKEYSYLGSSSFSGTDFTKYETRVGTFSLTYSFGHKRVNKITNYQNQDDSRFAK
jgi:hypothetical protein